jgi:hypothetical protein
MCPHAITCDAIRNICPPAPIPSPLSCNVSKKTPGHNSHCMKTILRAAGLAILVAIAGSSFAQSVVGSWRGHLVVDRSTLPKPKSANEAQQMEKQLKLMDTEKLSLTIRANKTFTFSGENMMGVPGKNTTEGIYKVSGKTMTMTAKTSDGKPTTGAAAQPRNLLIGPKTLTLLTPTKGAVKVSMIFTRA